MQTVLYLNNKKITKKQLCSMYGEERVNRLIEEAKQVHFEDPLIQNDIWLGGSNMLTIEFK